MDDETTTKLCEGRVVAITGAGRGLGREYALEFARRGAAVLVNDIGAERDGSGHSRGPAANVVDEIVAQGGAAAADVHDIASWEGAGAFVETALETFGGLDTLVNNAGIIRDRSLVNMSSAEWEEVVRVHLKGTAATMHHAARYWRDQFKAGRPRDSRVINTTSASGIFGNVGQSNYGAAKAGIAALTMIAAQELARYGVTVNAVYPSAFSRMTADLPLYGDPEIVASRDPALVAPFVVWLGSARSGSVTGRIFGSRGRTITLAEGWRAGPHAERSEAWSADEFDELVGELVRVGAPNVDINGQVPEEVADPMSAAATRAHQR